MTLDPPTADIWYPYSRAVGSNITGNLAAVDVTMPNFGLSSSQHNVTVPQYTVPIPVQNQISNMMTNMVICYGLQRNPNRGYVAPA